jgi:hypothetical protein
MYDRPRCEADMASPPEQRPSRRASALHDQQAARRGLELAVEVWLVKLCFQLLFNQEKGR